MLGKIRIIVAWVVFTLAMLLVLDFTGTLHVWLGWVARVQLVPAILAVNVVALVVVALLTFVFGRLYCSTLCPLGIMQDGVSWLSGRRKGKRARFVFTRPGWLRWALLALFAGMIVGGHIDNLLLPSEGSSVSWIATLYVSLLDPWASFGRIAENFFSPLWRWGNNLLAWFSERADSYAFYPVDVWVKSWIAFGVAAVWLVGLAVMAWWRGRWYCNSICPVGSLLGLISKISVFRPVFDATKCTNCGVCEKSCKSECIDSKTMTVDRSRCVVCFDCIDKCRFGAMKYSACKSRANTESTTIPIKSGETRGGAAGTADAAVAADASGTHGPAGASEPRAKKGISRRHFFSVAALAAAASPAALRAQQVERILLKVDGGLADLAPKERPERETPITPPGSKSARNMRPHCVACQLCVAACPNGVLTPSSKLATLMQPEMTFERGYCRPECVECGEVCPSGAIARITADDKTAISVGRAVYDRELCVVSRDNVPCTECQRHCPTEAITLVPLNDEEAAREARGGRLRTPILKIPVVDNTRCMGCGACENLCPSRPLSAIHVEGNSFHHSI